MFDRNTALSKTNEAWFYHSVGMTDIAISKLTEIIKSPHTPPEFVADAYIKRGSLRGFVSQFDSHGQIDDFTKATTIKGASAEIKDEARMNRAIAWINCNPEKAKDDIEDYLKTPDLPTYRKAIVYYNLGFLYEKKGTLLKAISYYSAVISMEGVDVMLLGITFLGRGRVKLANNDRDGGISDLKTVTSLVGVPEDVKNQATIILGGLGAL